MKIKSEVRIEATIRNILLSLVDLGIFLFEYGDKGRIYRRPIADYRQWRQHDGINFSRHLYYLKKKKMIKEFSRGKKMYIELTPKGKERVKYYFIRRTKIKHKNKWNGKWRVVIFDIAESKKDKREIIRKWLKNIGLIELQRSVYVYPFDFKKELDLMVGALVLHKDVKYMICDIIEGEDALIDYFFGENILSEDDLKSKAMR